MQNESIYMDPWHYDLIAQMTAPDDLAFYHAVAAEYGDPALELCCGTGRVCLALAAQGLRVTGLDASRPMVDRAKAKAEGAGISLELWHADVRAFELPEKFKTIIMPYNSINNLLQGEELALALARAGQHLAASGRIVFDTFNPSIEYLAKDTSQPLKLIEYMDPAREARVIMTETSQYDNATQINHITWHYEINGKPDAMLYHMQMRVFFPAELDALVRLEGLEIEYKFGSYDREPFEAHSPLQIVICRPTINR